VRRQLASAAALTLASCVSTAALAESQEGLSRLFPLQAEVRADGDGLARLLLPAEVLLEVRPDLSDLRVFDAAGNEIPFRVDSDARATSFEPVERVEARVLDVEREQGGTAEGEEPWVREAYVLAAPPDATGWELVVESGVSRFVRRIEVQTRGPDGAFAAGAESAPLFQLGAGTRRTRAAVPAGATGELRVVITGHERLFLEPTFRFESARTPPAPEQLEIPLHELTRGREDGKTWIELARPRGVAPDLLRLATTSSAFVREVRVRDLRPGGRDVSLGRGEVFRVTDVEHLEVPLETALGDRLRVEIADGDSPALAELAFTGVVRRPALVLPLTAGAPSAWLRFGGGRAYRPQYDLERLDAGGPAREAYELNRLATARLGAIEPNPAYDAAPALAFAMHPAAAADAALFEHRRALHIAPSAEGLARLRLAPEDLARARADLADLRLVDVEGRQWPFLLERDATQVELDAAVSAEALSGGHTRYRIVPRVLPVPVDELVIDASAPFFQRAFQLSAADRKQEGPIVRGQLSKDARRPAPARVPLDGARVGELELVVEDRDDAPLELTAQLVVPLPDLYAAVPAGDYRLLLGHPDAAPPRYELEAVRELVLGVASAEIEAGALEPNPDFRARARLGGGTSRQLLEHGLIWAALIGAVAVLAGITLRVVRQGSPDPPG
jgi:hypothetical protein